MSDRKSFTRLMSTVCSILMFLALVPAANAEDGKWDFAAGIYGWLPTINGSLTKELPGLGQEIEVDPGTLLENLSFTAMGTLAAKRNSWGLFGDVIYLKETKSADKFLEIGGGVNLSAQFTLNSWILNFGGVYEIGQTPGGSTFDILFGARYFNSTTTLTLEAGGPLANDETVESKANVWNGILGGSGRFALGKRWYIPYHLDFGAGDSDFTWQFMGGINYEFKWGGLSLAYRYLDFDQGEDSELKSLSFGGGEMGIYFRF